MCTFVTFNARLGVTKSGLKLLDEFGRRRKRQEHVVLVHLTIPVLVVVDIVAFNVNVKLVPIEILRHTNLEGTRSLYKKCLLLHRSVFLSRHF